MENITEIDFMDYIRKGYPSVKPNSTDKEKSEYLKMIGVTKAQKGGIKFSHNQFSRHFIKWVDLILLNNGKELAIYNQSKGIYVLNCDDLIGQLIKYMTNMTEDVWDPKIEAVVIKTIQRDIKKIAIDFNKGDFINLMDGVLDLDTFKLHPHSPKFLSTVQIPIIYREEQATPAFDKYLKSVTCNDKELQDVLVEIMGYCLCNSVSAEKAFFITGNGLNGKSVFASLLQLLVGKENCANVDLTTLNSNFGLSPLISANVNIAAENGCGRINSEKFKSIVSGDSVLIDRKYREPINASLHTKMVMVSNELPDSTDLSNGYLRKILIVPFRRTFKGDEIDRQLLEKLKKELSGIFKIALEGLKRLRENNYVFSHCKACDDAMIVYKKSLNPVSSFFSDCFVAESGTRIRRSDIYSIYERYCNDNSYEVMHRQKFWRALKFHFNDKEYPFVIKKVKGIEYLQGFSLKKTVE